MSETKWPELYNFLSTKNAFLVDPSNDIQFIFKSDDTLNISKTYAPRIELKIIEKKFEKDNIELIFEDNPEKFEKLFITKDRFLNPDYHLVFHQNQDTVIYKTKIHIQKLN